MVPYGQDRIAPIFLATLAVRAQSPIIKFRSAGEMLDTFGMQKRGKEYRRLVGAFQRIFGSTIFFATVSDEPKASVLNMSSFNFLRQARIWFNKDPDALPDQDGENVIVLSDQFYREVIAHPVPTDLEAVRMLNSAPAALDLFMFLSYRCFVAKGPEFIPIFGSAGLASQIGCGEYARPRKFREKLDSCARTNPSDLAGVPSDHQLGWPTYADRAGPGYSSFAVVVPAAVRACSQCAQS